MGVKTPIVALTANALESDKELFFQAGIDDFQSKVNTNIPQIVFNINRACLGNTYLTMMVHVLILGECFISSKLNKWMFLMMLLFL